MLHEYLTKHYKEKYPNDYDYDEDYGYDGSHDHDGGHETTTDDPWSNGNNGGEINTYHDPMSNGNNGGETNTTYDMYASNGNNGGETITNTTFWRKRRATTTQTNEKRAQKKNEFASILKLSNTEGDGSWSYVLQYCFYMDMFYIIQTGQGTTVDMLAQVDCPSGSSQYCEIGPKKPAQAGCALGFSVPDPGTYPDLILFTMLQIQYLDR